MEERQKRGRPRKHKDGAEAVRSYRKSTERRRFDVYLRIEASWRLTALSKAWGCSRGEALTRLVLEADERYGDILFPEIIKEGVPPGA
jgi:hypothetical protein